MTTSGLTLGDEVEDGVAVAQVDLGRGGADEVGEALVLEVAPDGRADQAAVPGDVDARVNGRGPGVNS